MFEAYSVGIRISLINGAAAGLLALSQRLQATHKDAKALDAQIGKIGKSLVVGGAMIGAGVGIFGLLSKTLPYAKAYGHEIALMNASGMQHAEVVKSIGAAWAASRSIPTSVVSENLAAIRELRSVVGNTGEAITVLPGVLKMQAILSSVKGVHDAKGTAYDVAKLLDIRGKTMSASAFQYESNLMTQAIIASGGTVDAKDFFSTGKYGRAATQSWSPEFLYRIVPTLIQEMKSGKGSGGAGGPGNALMSVYAAGVGGTISQKSLAAWKQLGLLDQSKVVWTKSGEVKGVLPGGIKDTPLMQSNPYLWAQQVMMPAIKAAGITDPNKQAQMISMLFASRTSGFMMQQLGMQGWKFERDATLIRGAKGLEAYNSMLKEDPVMAEAAMAAQWKNLMTAFGIEILPQMLDLMRQLVPVMADFTKWLRDNPKGLRRVVTGLEVLGGALIVLGSAKVLGGLYGALKLFGGAVAGVPIGALPKLAKGVLDVGAAAVGVEPAFATVGTAMIGLAGIASNVLLPALAGLALGVSVKNGLDFRKALNDPTHASDAELMSALAYAHSNSANYRKQLKDGTINRGTGLGFLFQWQKQEDVLAKERDRRAFVPGSSQGQPINVTTNVNVDGKRVAQAVTPHIAKGLGSTQAGPSRHDPNSTLGGPAAAYAR